ncbi:MAG: hypothetical protein C5B58_10915 [Acidobacteria bacterium]|nr:MAG: hypothetical protein C5B58_10915 [Acidobacteriota bacterium]
MTLAHATPLIGDMTTIYGMATSGAAQTLQIEARSREQHVGHIRALCSGDKILNGRNRSAR